MLSANITLNWIRRKEFKRDCDVALTWRTVIPESEDYEGNRVGDVDRLTRKVPWYDSLSVKDGREGWRRVTM